MKPRRATPHVRELLADTLTPLAVYRRLSVLSPARFLFESVSGGEQVSRFSILGAGPSEVLRLTSESLFVERQGNHTRVDGPPLEALRARLGEIEADAGPVPFTGGYVGTFGFDLIRLIERLPNRPADPIGLPVALLARFDNVVVFDHAYQRVLAIANEIEGESDAADAERRLAELEALLLDGAAAGVPALGAAALPPLPPAAPEGVVASLSHEAYCAAVETAKEHIRAGDIFQVVLARRFELGAAVDPLTLYRALRVINPSPYMVLLETPEVALVGASPEMLVRKKGRRLETRPIAGTRPRGADTERDRALAESLLADPKERAEHVMLVDLGRNDLGRVARPGSVAVTSFCEVERYSHVMHLVSNVQAELAARIPANAAGAFEALLACFPAGTVSGAPKIRAIEIIDSLEPISRGPYAGAVGYIGFSGDLDTCITIRTLVVAGGCVSVTAGAGIVADSDPNSEARETENKAAALLSAVALARALARQGRKE